MSWALITGASSGIGHDLAHLFARDGHHVVLVARNEFALRELGRELETRYGNRARVLAADLSRVESPEEIARALEDTEIEFLVNNAGFGAVGSFASSELTNQIEMIGVNITAVTALTRYFLPAMLHRGRGRILNVASIAAFLPGPFMAVYYASKAYVLSFSEAISEEIRGSGVTVTALCPGRTVTGFQEAATVPSAHFLPKPIPSMGVAEAGYAAMKRGKRIVVTGTINHFLDPVVRLAPRRLVTRLTRLIQQRG